MTIRCRGAHVRAGQESRRRFKVGRGRPRERAILTASMIDRPYGRSGQKAIATRRRVATVSRDDLVTRTTSRHNAVSAALTVSPLCAGPRPMAPCAMGIVEAQLVVNPTLQELERHRFDLIRRRPRTA